MISMPDAKLAILYTTQLLYALAACTNSRSIQSFLFIFLSLYVPLSRSEPDWSTLPIPARGMEKERGFVL